MAYTRAWDETTPTINITPANQIGVHMRNFKTDIRERVAGIFGLTSGEFQADPVAPKSLTLSVGLTGNVTGNLTGTVLTASQPNITSLGTLTSLTVSGRATVFDLLLTGSGASAQGLISKSAGTGFTIQTITGATYDFALINPANTFYIMNVATGTGVANFPSGLSGNLTGTVLTAAQGNITSVGTLISLGVTGNITTTGGYVTAQGLQINSAAGFIIFANAGIPEAYLGTSALDVITMYDRNGVVTNAHFQATFLSGTLQTAAQPNITSLGTQVATLNSTAQSIFAGSGQTTNPQYFGMTNTGNATLIITEGSAAGLMVVGSAAYASLFGTTSARSVQFFTNNNVRQTIDSAGNVVFTGTVTAANFVGPTSIDANNLTGTTLAANVVNSSLITLGTLSALLVNATTILQGINQGTATQYLQFQNTGGLSYVGIDNSAGGSFGFGAYNFGIYVPAGVGLIIDKTSRVVSAPAGFTGNVTGNLTGTVLTAAQGNITSLGTLTGLTVDGLITTKRLAGNSATPSIAAGTGAGSSPTVTVIGTDISGTITVITGTTPTANADVFTLTLAAAFPAHAFPVLYAATATVNDLPVAGKGVFIFSISTNNFVARVSGGALLASTTYKWHYHVIGD